MPLFERTKYRSELSKKIEELAAKLPYKEWYLPDPYSPASYVMPLALASPNRLFVQNIIASQKGQWGRLREKLSSIGINAWRGIRERYGREYASDPGDFGRGIYYTTSRARARAYGGENLIKQNIKLKNPLILDDKSAYDLAAGQYSTVGPAHTMEERMKNAERFTRDLIDMGYDGVVSVRKKSRYTSGGPPTELEVVDFSPYFKTKD